MARSPRTAQHATSSSTPTSSTSTPRHSTIIPPPFAQPGSSNQPSPVTRTRSRRASASSSRAPTALSTSSTTAPSTPALLTPTEGPPRLARSLVESKSHALRSVLGDKERSPCPFPAKYGGKDRCGVAEEDEQDEVLMAVCAACATTDNRALSADEIASIAIDQAWLRPPSAAVGPPTIVNNAIRAHLKRCASTDPPREPLVRKHLLAGSLNEAALESALHPDAFNGLSRPKGTVWYLAPSGRQKWKNPFDGLDIPIPPPRKPLAPKKLKKDLQKKQKHVKEVKTGRPRKEGSEEKFVKEKAKMPAGATPPVKIRLFLGGPSVDDDAVSEAGSSSQSVSKNPSRRPSIAAVSRAASTGPVIVRRPSRSVALGDSSDDSESSESEMEIDSRPVPSPLAVLGRGRQSKTRKDRPSPLALNESHENGHRHSAMLSRSIGSPIDWTGGVMPSPPYPSTYLPPPLSSPFPTHSLDNTTWTVRRDADRFAALETSSSSSEDEMRDPGEWGSSSSILIQGTSEDVESEIGSKEVWTAEDEEAKVKEATDALRVLFPISGGQEDDVDVRPVVRYNQLDNRPRPAPSDTSSLAESTSTATATARGPLKSADYAASVALAAYIPNSSPALSPNLKSQSLFYSSDASPSQHLSKLHNSFEPADMDIDEEPWLDESGELPVKAEDSLSDIDLGSVIGDTPTPEQDRQSTTAAWAREAASASFRVKEEPEDDYPSPITTEDPDDASAYRASRASSSDSHTPSSRASELPPFDMDPDVSRSELEEVLMGPESVSLEELDGWIMPYMGVRTDKTPQKSKGKWRHQHQRGKTEGARCSGDWGSIGVGLSSSLLLNTTRSTVHRVRSSKVIARRRQSSPTSPLTASRTGAESLPTPPDDDTPCPATGTEMDIDEEVYGIGPAELEAARAEAEAKEEEHRKAVQARAEQHKALLEAYRIKVKEDSRSGAISPDMEPASPWTDLNVAWGSSSTESINLHTPTPSAVPPAFLHSMFPTSPEGIMPTAMDPKALVSPPLGATTPMLDEVLSQAEVEAAMNKDKDVPMTGVVSAEGDKTATVELSTTMSNAAVSGAGSTTTSVATVPTPAATPAPTPAPAKKTKAKAEPKAPKEPKEIKPREPKSTSTTTTATSTPNLDKPAVTRPTPPQPRSITKPLCPGVDACVVDNIPVYSHSYINKKTGKSFVLLRRLDTDFVNASGLLLAVGIPVNKHAEYLSGPSPWQQAHHLVPAQANGAAYSPGVAGVWIPYSEAKVLAKKLKLDASSSLANILREDLFALFAKLAALNQEHQPSEAFGLPFGAPIRNQTKSLTTSSANSKSTPNLTALSSSAPAQSSVPAHLRAPIPASTPVQTPKGSLVRSAPATPPDGCPHPKRRRATIVGEASPMQKGPQGKAATVVNGVKPATPSHNTAAIAKVEQLKSPIPQSTPAPIKKPPPRAAKPTTGPTAPASSSTPVAPVTPLGPVVAGKPVPAAK